MYLCSTNSKSFALKAVRTCECMIVNDRCGGVVDDCKFLQLCERPCGPSHEVDDMLRQIVRDGARLDIPDDTRGRIPLHFAISCDFWCRVKTLLHLRYVFSSRN